MDEVDLYGRLTLRLLPHHSASVLIARSADVLGIPKTATKTDIKKAFRKVGHLHRTLL